jgi:hypothetical protein
MSRPDPITVLIQIEAHERVVGSEDFVVKLDGIENFWPFLKIIV